MWILPRVFRYGEITNLNQFLCPLFPNLTFAVSLVRQVSATGGYSTMTRRAQSGAGGIESVLRELRDYEGNEKNRIGAEPLLTEVVYLTFDHLSDQFIMTSNPLTQFQSLHLIPYFSGNGALSPIETGHHANQGHRGQSKSKGRTTSTFDYS